jgi:hypothetical protein
MFWPQKMYSSTSEYTRVHSAKTMWQLNVKEYTRAHSAKTMGQLNVKELQGIVV